MEKSRKYKDQTVLVKTLIDAKYECKNLNDKRTKEEFVNDELDNIKAADKSFLDLSYQVGINEIAAKTGIDAKEFEEMLSTESKLNENTSSMIQNSISGKDILQILSKIHDKWVNDNSKRFAGNLEQGNGYQYGPIEMIGWKEAKSNLLFLKPMFEAAGVEVRESQLEAEYDNMQKNFMIGKGIRTQEDYAKKLAQGGDFYKPLNGEEKSSEEIVSELENGVYVEPISYTIKNNPAIASKISEQTFEKVTLKGRKDPVNETHDIKEFGLLAKESIKEMSEAGNAFRDAEQEKTKANKEAEFKNNDDGQSI